MLAYEYYWKDEENRVHSIGIIPERRRGSERITDESILSLGKTILGEEAGLSNLFFVQLTIDETVLIDFFEPTIEESAFVRI